MRLSPIKRKQVRAPKSPFNHIPSPELLQTRTRRRGIRELPKTHQVDRQTNNVGCGHRGSGDGVGGVVRPDPGGEDSYPGGEDVDDRAVVGE